LTFFQVSRESQQSEWAHVQASLTLALRVNDTRLVIGSTGSLNGERNLSLQAHDAHPATTMHLSLFVVPGEATTT
jgi:hypothetical protein